MPQYPSALPEPQLGSAFTTAENRLVTQGDVAQQNRIIDRNHRQTLSLSWTLTDDQFRIFEGWHRWYLHGGVSRFSVTWGGRDGIARILSPVAATLTALNWQVSTEVEIDYAVSGGY